MEDTLDSNEKRHHTNLYEGIQWWEKRRLWFNLAVGIAGLIPLLGYMSYLILADFIGVVMFGVAANVCFCAGYILEALDLHYLKGRLNIERYRLLLFTLGTAASVLMTIVLSWGYGIFLME